jgi:hypothetical protein
MAEEGEEDEEGEEEEDRAESGCGGIGVKAAGR